MNKPSKTVLQMIAVFYLSFSSVLNASATDYVVDQLDKKFSQTNLTIRSGDMVTFTNSDPMTHNIHSLTMSDSFDLGSYDKSEVRTHIFHTKGVHQIECAIHPFMTLKITVK